MSEVLSNLGWFIGGAVSGFIILSLCVTASRSDYMAGHEDEER